MKKNTISSGLAFVYAAVLTMVLVSMSFAEDPNSSNIVELKDKIKNMENKIEQYKRIVSQARPGEIILYEDPSTSNCMAITTSSFTNYLKEKGLTPPEIKEQLAIWDEKSAEIKKRVEKDIVLMGSELPELRNKLTQIEKPGASSGTENIPAAARFDDAAAQVEAEPRKQAADTYRPEPLQDVNESRPGYRPAVTPASQEFYRYVMDKIGRGEELTLADNLTIRAMIATRSWPEAPTISENDRNAGELIERHNTVTSDAMEAMRASAGKLDYDLQARGDLEKFRRFYHNTPPENRPYMARVMMAYYKSLGFDMRSDEQRKGEQKQREKTELKAKEERQAEQDEAERKAERERQGQQKGEDFLNEARERDRLARENQVKVDQEEQNRAEAREQLIEMIRDSKEEGETSAEKKLWKDLTPEERQEWLKRLENLAKDLGLGDVSINSGTEAQEGVSDGVYKGTFTGGASGSLTIIINKNGVSGNLSGTQGGDPIRGSFSGTVDLSGNIRSTITGTSEYTIDSKPLQTRFSGTMDGVLGGSTASGSWKASFGNGGSWKASK